MDQTTSGGHRQILKLCAVIAATATSSNVSYGSSSTEQTADTREVLGALRAPQTQSDGQAPFFEELAELLQNAQREYASAKLQPPTDDSGRQPPQSRLSPGPEREESPHVLRLPPRRFSLPDRSNETRRRMDSFLKNGQERTESDERSLSDFVQRLEKETSEGLEDGPKKKQGSKEPDSRREISAQRAQTSPQTGPSPSAEAPRSQGVAPKPKGTPPRPQPSASDQNIRENDEKLAEARNRERVALQVRSLGDGQVGPAVGVEASKPEFRAEPIYQLLGVGTTPDKMLAGAEALAEATRRPVIPINNASAVQRLAEEIERQTKYAPDSLAARLDRTAAEIFGRIEDGARTVFDRTMPAEFAVEPSTETIALLANRQIAKEKKFFLVAHSQGSVIAQNAMILLAHHLDEEVQAKIITEAEKKAALARITIFAVGAFARESDWPSGLKIVSLNSKDDPISSLGEHNDWFQKEGQNFTFDSHNYLERYIPMITQKLDR